jgi:hypothetical protein
MEHEKPTPEQPERIRYAVRVGPDEWDIYEGCVIGRDLTPRKAGQLIAARKNIQ